MNDSFELPVFYNNEEILLPAGFEQVGYTHRIIVDINGTIIFFEPDEERNYRAVLKEAGTHHNIDPLLVQSIVESLEKHFK